MNFTGRTLRAPPRHAPLMACLRQSERIGGRCGATVVGDVSQGKSKRADYGTLAAAGAASRRGR